GRRDRFRARRPRVAGLLSLAGLSLRQAGSALLPAEFLDAQGRRRLGGSLRQQIEKLQQIERVVDGVPRDVVVEVREGVAPVLRERAGDAPEPALAIAAAVLPGRAVEAQVAEPAGVRGRRTVDEI